LTAGLEALAGLGLGAGFFVAGDGLGAFALALTGCFATIFACAFTGDFAGVFAAILTGALVTCFPFGIGFRASETLANIGLDLS
jgi:hypothetical protein